MSEPIDEVNVGTALDLIGRKAQGKPAPMACCPRCPGEVPLVSTLRFPGAEFYCVECGAKVGFLSPKPVEATPELHARHAELRARFEADEVRVEVPDDEAPEPEPQDF